MYPQEYNLPVYIGTGAVLTSGGTDKLTPGQVGVFDAKTYSAVVSNIAQDQSLMIAGGSWHTKDKLNKFVGNLKASEKSVDFLGKDIMLFEKSLPRKAANEQWVIGWDGIGNDSLAFQCGRDYTFKVTVWGEDVYGTFLRPVDRFIRVRTKCCDTTNCDTGDCDATVVAKTYAKELAKAINEDPELKYFVKAEIISSDYSAPSATHELQTLTVADEGDQIALSAVQTAFPSYSVTRISREGIYSVYEVCVVADTSISDFTPTGKISLAACDGTCPSGYTAVAGSTVYSVVRPITPSTDLSDNSAKQTFADAIGTAYETATAVTFAGTGVNTTTEVITIGSHTFTTGAKVTYSNGGGTSITGLTTGTDYYVIKVSGTTVKLATTLANALAGTAVNLSGAGVGSSHSLTPVITATFLSKSDAVAVVELKVPLDVTLTALLSDNVVLTRTEGASCVAPSPSAVSWVVGEDRYKTTRTLSLKLEKECGTATRLAELQAFYANVSDVVSGSLSLVTSGECGDEYQIQQYSNSCSVDNCMSEAEVFYNDLQSFEGFAWTVVPASEASDTVKAGVRLTTAYEDTRFGGCSFNPSDYYSVRPLKLEITEFDDSGLPCHTPVPSRKLRNASMSTQSGEWVIRKFINANKYRAFGEFYTDPRLREVLDANIHQVVDTKKKYKCYFLKVRQNRAYQNGTSSIAPEIFEIMFAFPEDVNTSTFETTIEKVTGQFGVFLKNR